MSASLDRSRPICRRTAVLVTAIVGLGALVSNAAADANVVSLTGTSTAVAVQAKTGPDGSHGMIIEPYDSDGANFGMRVRQDRSGRPSFIGSPGCNHNPIFNDVLCVPGGRGAVNVSGGDGTDVIVASGVPGGRELTTEPRSVGVPGDLREFQLPDHGGGDGFVPSRECSSIFVDADGNPQQPPVTIVTVTTGKAADFIAVADDFSCVPGSILEGEVSPRLVADGGPGNDSIAGGSLDDQLTGGTGPDKLAGGDGDDDFRGDNGTDVMLGGPGNDIFRAGLPNGGGPDQMIGEDGIDVVSYQGTTPVSVTIDALANDGRAGESDFVDPSIERVEGSFADDVLTGDSGPNDFDGASGNDRLIGNDGDDTLSGNAGRDDIDGGFGADRIFGSTDGDDLDGGNGDDEIFGGPGRDAIDARLGNDTIEDRDGERDLIVCGIGVADPNLDNDFAEVDLQDVVSNTCENVDRAPADDGLPAHVVETTIETGSASMTLTVDCPQKARVRCRGTLELRRGTPDGLPLGNASYNVGVGRTRRVTVKLTAAHAARRARVIVATTDEQGDSTIGRRSSIRQLTVTRQ